MVRDGARPNPCTARDPKNEVRQVLLAAGGVDHFGVKLYSVEAAPGRRDGSDGAGAGAPRDRESGRHAAHHVAMAHPDLLRAAESARTGGRPPSSSSSVARPYSPFIALADLSAQQVRHELLPVADTEHRDAERKDGRIDGGALRVVDAARSAGNDEAPCGREFRRRRLAGADLRVDAQVAHFTGNQVAVLAPRIEDDNLSCRVQLSMVASRVERILTSQFADLHITEHDD